MNVLATIVSVVLGMAFLAAGLPKVLRTTSYRERVRHWRLPERLLPAIGLVEVGGATLLLVAAAAGHEQPAIAGAALLVATMAGAILTHVRIADPPARALPPTLLGILATLDIALLNV
jgi:uncharacterized membrane protein YphA (DoxX/SURF4 family)